MYKIRMALLAFIAAAAVLFQQIPAFAATAAGSGMKIARVSMSKTSLTPGELSADIVAVNTKGSERVFASLGYYGKNGELKSFSAVHGKSADAAAGEINQITLSINIDEDVSRGDYARVVVMSGETLQPYGFQGTDKITCELMGLITGVETEYKGMAERYYTLGENETVFRLKDMGDGTLAMEEYSSALRLDENAALTLYSSNDKSQHWTVKPLGGGYSFMAENGKYLSVSRDGFEISEAPAEIPLKLAGETPFSLATSLEGYKLLTDDQKQRLTEIYTSVGAVEFRWQPGGKSLLERGESIFAEVYENRGSLNAQQQKEKLEEALSLTVFSGICSRYEIEPLPGGDGTVSVSQPVADRHVIWDLSDGNEEIDCFRIDFTITDSSHTQRVSLYTNDPEFGNVAAAPYALAKFPYDYRKNIQNMYVYKSSANQFNCGAHELFVRTSSVQSEKDMVLGFAHELGHSADAVVNGEADGGSGNWSHGEAWKNHIKNDMISISTYAQSNADEDFAEFSRLYFQCFGNQNRQIAIKQLFPNQFASFERMLDKLGMEHLY